MVERRGIEPLASRLRSLIRSLKFQWVEMPVPRVYNREFFGTRRILHPPLTKMTTAGKTVVTFMRLLMRRAADFHGEKST